MPPLGAVAEVAKVGAEAAAEVAPRFITNLVELLGRPASRLADGAQWSIINPKTGERLETLVSAHVADGCWWTRLYTRAKEEVASFCHTVGPTAEQTHTNFKYGDPPMWRPYVDFEFMRIAPGFRGKGVREAVVNELRQHSTDLGFNGRVRCFAFNEMGTVSAIPWYKSGFRPQPYAGMDVARFHTRSRLLSEVVETRMRLTLEQGKLFDGMPLYLPE